MKYHIPLIVFIVLGAVASALAQQAPAGPRFDDATQSIGQQLRDSLAELSALRQQIADQTIPLNRQLNELESKLTAARAEFQQASRTLDGRTLDLTNLRNEIKAREEENGYLSNLFSEYVRNFESRLHIAELQRYGSMMEEAKLAPENSNLSTHEVFGVYATLIAASLDRIEDTLGGTRFDGKAVGPDGLISEGKFLLVGPVALFRADHGALAGTADQRLGSLEPNITGFEDPLQAGMVARLVQGTGNELLLDPTLGNAHVIEQTQETLWEHIKKGGPVMIPIFGLAGAALLVALGKWLALTLTRSPSRKRVAVLLDAVAMGKRDAAIAAARRVGGPTGRMLSAGVQHLDEPRELIEEVMFEQLLTTKLKLQRFLPFIAICASAAPLLGLLGTVTGIMNTFKLITVFGTGDVKTLSSGISEALITTEYGLIVAIPSLLIHAFLSRKARTLTDRMEQSAIALLNQLGKTPSKPQGGSQDGGDTKHHVDSPPRKPETPGRMPHDPQPEVVVTVGRKSPHPVADAAGGAPVTAT